MSATSDIRPGAKVVTTRGCVVGTVVNHPDETGAVDLRVGADQRHRFMDPPDTPGPWLMPWHRDGLRVLKPAPRDTLPDLAKALGGTVTPAPRRGVWLSEAVARSIAREVVR